MPTVQSASKLFRSLCYQNKDRLLASIIVAGWDPVDGGSVYEIPLGGTCVKLPFAMGGSGSTYIYGFVDSHYRPGALKPAQVLRRRPPSLPTAVAPSSAVRASDRLFQSAYADLSIITHQVAGMNKEECLDFVRRALSHAMARDGSSGGVIRTVSGLFLQAIQRPRARLRCMSGLYLAAIGSSWRLAHYPTIDRRAWLHPVPHSAIITAHLCCSQPPWSNRSILIPTRRW